MIFYSLLYVNDMLLIGRDTSHIKRSLSSESEMKVLGHAKSILGMDIVTNRPKQVLHLK